MNDDETAETTAKDRIDRLERTVETLAERLVELETERGGSGRAGTAASGGIVSRRSVLGALGLAGLAGLGATTAAGDPQGKIGTSSDPLRTLNVEAINAGLASTEFELSVGGNRALLLGQEEQTQSLAGPVVLGHSNNRASGPAATVSGGGRRSALNEAGRNASVGGGTGNKATANDATIAGGAGNDASGRQAAIGGGISHVADALQATIGGGNGNTATGETTTVGGGHDNTASGTAATVGGGVSNVASAEGATVPGGRENEATAPGSFAAGTTATARHEGSFIWSDQSGGGRLYTVRENQFAVRAAGGVVFASDPGALSGVELASGSGSWSSLSSRARKSDVEPVAGETVLEQVTDLEISRWSYDSQSGVRHMGPMAEDFHDAFGLGDDEEQISNVDADGVALAAIQGLIDRNAALAERVTALEEDDAGTEGDSGDATAGGPVTARDVEKAALRAEVAGLRATNDELREEVAQQGAAIEELRADLDRLAPELGADGDPAAVADGQGRSDPGVTTE